jgi:hypothetical protein
VDARRRAVGAVGRVEWPPCTAKRFRQQPRDAGDWMPDWYARIAALGGPVDGLFGVRGHAVGRVWALVDAVDLYPTATPRIRSWYPWLFWSVDWLPAAYPILDERNPLTP